jgi:hypothetical protein
MKLSAAAIAAHADAPSASRESSARCAFALYCRGHLPGIDLSHLGFRLLLFLLGQRPGAYAAHYETIATQLRSNRDSVMREAHRLREAGLLRCELIPPHHPLPFRAGSYTRTNVLRFDVDVERLGALLEVGGAPSVAKVRPSTGAKPPPSTGAKPPPSPRTIEIYEPQPPSSKPPPNQGMPEPPGGREAVSKELGGREMEIEPVAQAWLRLGLGELGAKERKALENRLHEGATLEQLLDAVAGAAEHAWLRTGARSAFAVVFANLPAVARFAHDGRKLGCSTVPPRAASSIPSWGGRRPSQTLAPPCGPVVPAVAAVAREVPTPMPAETRAALEHLGRVFGAGSPIAAPGRASVHDPPRPLAQGTRSQEPGPVPKTPLNASARREATHVAPDGCEAQERLQGAWAPPRLAAAARPPGLPQTDFRDDGPIERGPSRGSGVSPIAFRGVVRKGNADTAVDGRVGREGPAQRTGSACSEGDGELPRLLQGLGGHSARPRDPTETEHDRLRRAQEHFDHQRHELLAALRALDG